MKSPAWILSTLFAIFTFLSGCSNPPPPSPTTPPSLGATPSMADELADNSFGVMDPDVHYIPVLDAGDDVKLGARFDTLSGRIISSSTCLAGHKEAKRGDTGTQIRLVEVSDSQSTMRAMNIDASVQGNFLVSSVSAKASFVSSQEYTQRTQNFVLYAQATAKPRALDTLEGETLFDLTPAARTALHNGPQDFRTLCGDSYIASIYEGVELYGMLTFENVSQKEKQSISAAMKGTYGQWSGESSAKKTVDSYSDSGRSSLQVSLEGQCSDVNIQGDKVSERWSNVVNSVSALDKCAKQGANMISFKVVPYNSQTIKNWPDHQQQDPEFSLILNRYARYGTVLDSINLLLTAKATAYKLALLNRGIDFKKLHDLGAEIRAKRLALLELLDDCQKSASPQSHNAECKTNQKMLDSLDEFPDPYLYWAQLPLFFATDQPLEAFKTDAELTALILSRIQQQKDNACALADKYKYSRDPACPADFSQLLQQVRQRINVAPYPWPLNSGYVFVTQSTSTNRCMVAPNEKKKNATTSTCKKPYTRNQQRFLWRDSYQLYIRTAKSGEQCLSGRGLARCDSKQPAQLWRFVPSPDNPQIGLLQSAEDSCLHHAKVDINATYKSCSDDALSDDSFLWRAVSGQ